MAITVSDATFAEQVLGNDKPVLVDFWAPWCGPCKMIAPMLEGLEEEFQEQLVIAKVNVDENPATVQQYGLRGIPTLMLFRDGSLVSQKTGAVGREQLSGWVRDELELAPSE